MKKAIAIIAVMVVIFMGFKCFLDYFFKDKETGKYTDLKGILPQGFTYTAHTGCCGTQANSIASIEKGVSCGANIVEFDLKFTKSGEPVLCHDAIKGNEVTVDEAFAKISEYDGIYVNVDRKTSDALHKIPELAKKHGISDRIFFTGVEEEAVEAVKKACPGVDYYLNMEVKKPSKHTDEYLLSLVEKVKECGAVGINFNKKSASKKLVDTFHENGLLVSIFTVDKKAEMYKILLFAPDNITTRNPDLLGEILKD